MEKPVNARLLNTHSKEVHKLREGRQIIASHPHLVDSSSLREDIPHVIIHPPTPTDQYCCEVVVGEGGGAVSVLVGECKVNGEVTHLGDEPKRITNETFLDLGQSLRLQFVMRSSDQQQQQQRRVLPQTPGQTLSNVPPSKPRRTTHTAANSTVLQPLERSATGSSEASSEGALIEPELRMRLQRISREVNERRTGYQNRKPPPPYEQVGNSIGFQLLLQSHKDVSSQLIDSLYAPLKELELKDASLAKQYDDYLAAISLALNEGATPECLHPGDVPTVKFLVELTVHACSIPKLNDVAVKHCPLWMRLVDIMCVSEQNQLALVGGRGPSHILSCMNLTIMAESTDFQRCGWNILALVVNMPTPPGKKPALRQPSVVLAISLLQHQLEQFNSNFPLVSSILHFLAQLAATARECSHGRNQPQAYTVEQATQILSLLREKTVLRDVMKVPQTIRKHKDFDVHYCTLVRSLAPTRSRREATPPRATPPRDPPEKPKRLCQKTLLNAASEFQDRVARFRKSRKSRKQRKLPPIPVQSSSSELPPNPVQSNSSEDLEASTESADYPSTQPSPKSSHRRSKSVDCLDFDLPESPIPSPSALLEEISQRDGCEGTKAQSEGVSPVDSAKISLRENDAHRTPCRTEIELSKGTATEIESSKGTATEIEPSKGTATEIEPSKGTATEIEPSKGTLTEIEPSKGTATEIEPSKGTATEIEPSKGTATEIEPSKGTLTEIELSKGTATEIEPSKGTATEIEPSKGTRTEIELSNGTETEIELSNGTETELEPSKGTATEIESSKGTPTEIEPSKGTRTEIESSLLEHGSLAEQDRSTTDTCSDEPSTNDMSVIPLPTVCPTSPDSLAGDDTSVIPPPTVSPTSPDSLAGDDTSVIPPPTVSPTSPDSLAGDVQHLLNDLSQPVSRGEGARRPGSRILVPAVNRESWYYRHSLKRRKYRIAPENRVVEPPTPVYTGDQSPSRSGRRMSWGLATPPQPIAGRRESQLFELSGEELSKDHTAIEDISSGHDDIRETLDGRVKLCDSVCRLWRADKGLQAATNTMQGCFSGNADVPLFIDIINCFCDFQSPWTLAVCVVLLPALRQLVGNQQEEHCVVSVCSALTMIIQRFSTVIGTCKVPSHNRRLSSQKDHHSKVVCYRQLHDTCVTVDERLGQECDIPNITRHLKELKTSLKPYQLELEMT